MSALKKAMIAVLAFVLVGVLLFGALIGWAVIADQEANEKATALCGPTVVGSPAGAVLERARRAASGTQETKWRDAGDGNEELHVVFPAGLPLSGYVCMIHARDGVVTATEIQTVD